MLTSICKQFISRIRTMQWGLVSKFGWSLLLLAQGCLVTTDALSLKHHRCNSVQLQCFKRYCQISRWIQLSAKPIMLQTLVCEAQADWCLKTKCLIAAANYADNADNADCADHADRRYVCDAISPRARLQGIRYRRNILNCNACKVQLTKVLLDGSVAI